MEPGKEFKHDAAAVFLSRWSLASLRKEADRLELPGREKMDRAELVTWLTEAWS